MSNNIYKSIVQLFSGALLAQCINFSMMPIITRMYSPEDFGLFSIFTVATMLLTPFVTFKYSIAIPLAKRTETAINIAVLCAIINIAVAILLSVILLITYSVFGSTLDNFNVEVFVMYLPISFLLIGFFEILSSFSSREKLFKQISICKVFQTMVSNSIKIIFGALSVGVIGLVYGYIALLLSGCVFILYVVYNKYDSSRSKPRFSRQVFFLKRFSNFPQSHILSDLLRILSIQSPILFFTISFGKDIVGQLSLAIMVVTVPVSLLGQTSRQAFYAEIASIGKKNTSAIGGLFRFVALRLVILGVIASLSLYFLSEIIFTLVFGDNWRLAGQFASILAIYVSAQLVYLPTAAPLLDVFEKNWLLAKLDIFRTIIVILMFISCYILELSPQSSLLVYAITLTVYYFISIFCIYNGTLNEKK
ncbi:oligosaccharide flippase family protein [Vibrio cyclitrophicus]|uniref:oligosaccharide flippase family protein n=1 Tax=Vibrio cyclitrophicus TaxID=47951 RepID=UPI00080DF57A|nr:oligosaccharide flippase family protein [Vibrio cyclitrophicus]OCH40310.1 hypothetical protein A6E07_10990 [Vibrio cyclitrophicus]